MRDQDHPSVAGVGNLILLSRTYPTQSSGSLLDTGRVVDPSPLRLDLCRRPARPGAIVTIDESASMSTGTCVRMLNGSAAGLLALAGSTRFGMAERMREPSQRHRPRPCPLHPVAGRGGHVTARPR